MANWLRLHWKKLMFVALVLGALGFGFVRKAVEDRVTSEWTEVNQEMQSLLATPGQSGNMASAAPSVVQNASAEPKAKTAESAAPVQTPAPAAPVQSPAGTTAAKGLIDINTASASRLDELPGIGPGKAQAIVEHRQAKGLFRTPEELKNVKGIGQKTYDGLKDRITASVAP
jgi:competence protein ComEA